MYLDLSVLHTVYLGI